MGCDGRDLRSTIVPRPFLTARWSNLVLLTFEAPEQLVRSHVTAGIDLDRWNGRTHVSLVALEMLNVRVFGQRIPGFTTHPQVNFRLYVRPHAAPAVWFVRELVPSRLIAAVGRLLYREPFQVARLEARFAESADDVTAEYRFGPGTRRYHILVTGSRSAAVPPTTSFEHYLKERTSGCRTDRRRRPQTFRVQHPPWAVREVKRADYDVDFGALYGQDWRFLNDRTPVSVIFAVGSEVTVYRASGAPP